MQNIYIEGNLLIYYGNTAGYIESGKAVVDSMFESKELSEWLSEYRNLRCQFHDGVYQRIMDGHMPKEVQPEQAPASVFRCRLWQLKPESDILIRFKDYDAGRPPRQDDYYITHDCDTASDNPEEAYNQLQNELPPGFEGHPISISDVLELYSRDGSIFYYIGKTKYIPVDFKPQEKENISEAK